MAYTSWSLLKIYESYFWVYGTNIISSCELYNPSSFFYSYLLFAWTWIKRQLFYWDKLELFMLPSCIDFYLHTNKI